MANFEEIKSMVEELGYTPENEDYEQELFSITDPSSAINSLIIDCEDPILVFEMVVMALSEDVDPVRLLQMNREMVHGAFAIDDNKKIVIWRDTLQMENLDLNEIQGSINALTVAMTENADELIKMAKGGN